MIIEHRTRDKHQNADNLKKKTEFYERLEEKQANQAEIKDGFSFLDKETYDKLPLTRWLDKSGHPHQDTLNFRWRRLLKYNYWPGMILSRCIC